MALLQLHPARNPFQNDVFQKGIEQFKRGESSDMINLIFGDVIPEFYVIIIQVKKIDPVTGLFIDRKKRGSVPKIPGLLINIKSVELLNVYVFHMLPFVLYINVAVTGLRHQKEFGEHSGELGDGHIGVDKKIKS
jgi:hypothetical protein